MTTITKLASMKQIPMKLRMIISTTNPRNFVTKATFSSQPSRANCTDTIPKGKKHQIDQPILSSPCLILPVKEAINEAYRPQTFLGRCLYDLGKKSFVPKNSNANEGELKTVLSKDAKCIGSSHGWLAFFDPKTCLLFLMDPLTFRTIPLPPLETLPGFIGPCFNKSSAGGKDKSPTKTVSAFRCLDDEDKEELVEPKYLSDEFFGKIILSSSPVLPDNTNSPDCKVVMVCDGEKTSLAFCRIGDARWTNLIANPSNSSCGYEDVVYSNKNRKFYGLLYTSCDIQIDVWDLDDSCLNPKRTVLQPSESSRNLNDYEFYMRFDHLMWPYLVESSSGEILMVNKYTADHVADEDVILKCFEDPCSELPRKTIRIDVFKLDQEKQKFKFVKNLGDQALFLGENHSFSVPASKFPNIKANSIYFGDRYFKVHFNFDDYHSNFAQSGIYGGHDFGIFNLEDNSISPCYQSETKNFSPLPIWLEPNDLVRN